MEVVDAEYQWYSYKRRSDSIFISNICCRDRRKLTFYFIAEKRIDFRELVRELFRQVSLSHVLLEFLTFIVALSY